MACALSRDLTAAEIELSVAGDAGLPAVLAVPPLVLVLDAEPELPERAAPPSMATAQPDSTALIIAATSATA